MEVYRAVWRFGRFASFLMGGAPPQLLCTFDRAQRETPEHPRRLAALVRGCLALPFSEEMPASAETAGTRVFDTPPFEKNAPAGLIRVTGIVDNLRWCVSGVCENGLVRVCEINGVALPQGEGWKLLDLLEAGSAVNEAEKAVLETGGLAVMGGNRETLLFLAEWPIKPSPAQIIKVEQKIAGNLLCRRFWQGEDFLEPASNKR